MTRVRAFAGRHGAGHLLSAVPGKGKDEQFVDLLVAENVRIERIVSRGHACGADDWYEDEEAEWVLVVAGAARLSFERDPEPLALGAGDYALIPAGTRHRVDWTDPEQPTIWLAVHFK